MSPQLGWDLPDQNLSPGCILTYFDTVTQTGEKGSFVGFVIKEPCDMDVFFLHFFSFKVFFLVTDLQKQNTLYSWM
jgi:hypothetical protein